MQSKIISYHDKKTLITELVIYLNIKKYIWDIFLLILFRFRKFCANLILVDIYVRNALTLKLNMLAKIEMVLSYVESLCLLKCIFKYA